MFLTRMFTQVLLGLLWALNTYAQPAPIVKDTSNSIVISGQKYYIVQVKPGQTLYSFTKVYSVTEADIFEANASVKQSGLKAGQTIKIPAKKGAATIIGSSPPPTTIKIDVPPTLLVADSLKANYKKLCANKASKKPVYDVGLFLPLHGDTGKFNIKSSVALEFYEGALMAVEDFNDTETELRVHIYDTQNDSTNVKEVLKNDNIKNLDLVIGPLFASGFQRVSTFLLPDSIVCVSPFSQTFKVIEDNPNAHKITPAAITIVDQCAQYIGANYKKQNIVFIASNYSKDSGNMQLYHDRIKDAATLNGTPFKEDNFNTKGALNENLLVAGKKNLVVFPSGDQTAVTLMITRLNELSAKYDITLWGINQWQNFDDLDLQKLTKLNMHFARTAFADKSDGMVTALNARCREKYKVDASEYFFQGYDVMYYYANMLKKYGRNLTPCLLCEKEQTGIQTDIQFGINNAKPGIENTSVILMEYKDNRIVKVANP